LLEAVRELERVGVEEGELLLDRDREVLPVVECLAGEPDLLFRGQTPRVAHVTSVNEALAAARRRWTSSRARPRRGGPPGRAHDAFHPGARGAASTSARDPFRSSRAPAAPADRPTRDRRRSRPVPNVVRRAAVLRPPQPRRRPCRTPPGRWTERRRRRRAAEGARGAGAREGR